MGSSHIREGLDRPVPLTKPYWGLSPDGTGRFLVTPPPEGALPQSPRPLEEGEGEGEGVAWYPPGPPYAED